MVILLISMIVSAIISAIIAPLLREEFQVRAPDWALAIVWRAVQRLPADRQDRYFEEWCAYLDGSRTPLSKFITSLGFSFASVRMSVQIGGKARLASLGGDVGMRALDAIGAVMAIVAFGPLLFIVASAIFLNDPGPVIFRQRRVGRGGRVIHVYKFRTMVMNPDKALSRLLQTDDAAKEEWLRNHRLANDPRISRVGRFLRKSSLDELPQFFNVLGGTMSFVGPRPIVDAEVARYGKHFRDYISVRPGITGLWQIFSRGGTSYRRRVALDKLFARKRSLKVYLLLLVLTIPAVLFQWDR